MADEQFKILIIDDSEITLAMEKAILEQHGYEVRAANTLMQFETTLKDWRPHLILTDIHMPEVKGTDICRVLKHEYDTYFGIDRPVAYGHVYATLARLLKGGLVTVDAVEPGEGPERKRYAITEAGVADVESWLARPEPPETYLQNVLYAKVILALRSGRSATDVLDAQRSQHLQAMRELTRRKTAGDLADQLICDHALFHLEADLRWLELTAARIEELAGQVAA